jgi:hypothetical protein
VPNHAAVEAMARSAGLEPFEHPAAELWLCRPGAAARPVQDELAAAGGLPAGPLHR